MLPNHEGQKVPSTTFQVLVNRQLKHVPSEALFSGKRVAVFSLPGAFTPTCSSSHVPRFNELASALKQEGVEAIYCISVNDAFVMDAWAQDQKAENITFLADGNGTFTDGMGLLVDKSHLGFGKRSWRYSMLVKDGVVEKMFIEPEKEGDPFEVSDADTMLHHLNPQAKQPPQITVFSKAGCAHCARAKRLLQAQELAYDEVELSPNRVHQILKNVAGQATTPQIYIDGQYIGGANELETWLNQR